MKSLVKAIVPQKYHGVLGSLRHLRKNVECPCCGGRFNRFLPYGVVPRPNARCPQCGTMERHRLLWLYLRDRTNFFSDAVKVLHFAPEPFFQNTFHKMRNLDYISADIAAPSAMVRMDITNITFDDNTFDVVLCCHVLEHIPDDIKAMGEILRVLKPGGWAILQVPLDTGRERTYEDFSITSPAEREMAFGQTDHVRIYGRDYRERLEKAGFIVNVDQFSTGLSAESIKRYGLVKGEDVYYCTKPGNGKGIGAS